MSNRLVTLATYPNPTEAGFIKNLLEAEGIPACLADETAAGMLSYLTNAIGWVKLQVNEQDVTRANELLEMQRQAIADLGPEAFAAEATSSPDLDEVPEGTPASLDPAEPEEDVVDPTEELASRALRAAGLGVICTPIMLYAVWLIGKLVFSKTELSDTASRKLWLAFGLALAVMLGFWVFLTNN